MHAMAGTKHLHPVRYDISKPYSLTLLYRDHEAKPLFTVSNCSFLVATSI